MSEADKAVELFAQGFNCSQAVAAAFAERLGVDEETCLKAAAAFGGGMGRMGQTCGAATGAYIALGLRYGAVSPQDKPAKERVYGLVRQFAAKFVERNGKILCCELLGLDLSTPEGQRLAAERSIHAKVCPKFVRDAAEILEEML